MIIRETTFCFILFLLGNFKIKFSKKVWWLFGKNYLNSMISSHRMIMVQCRMWYNFWSDPWCVEINNTVEIIPLLSWLVLTDSISGLAPLSPCVCNPQPLWARQLRRGISNTNTKTKTKQNRITSCTCN